MKSGCNKPKTCELHPGGAPERPATRAELESLRQKIADLVSQSPDKAAIILTEWLKQGDIPQKKRKTG